MLIRVITENARRVDGHRAIEEDGHIGQAPFPTQCRQQMQNRLRTADGKRRDDYNATTIQGLRDHVGKPVQWRSAIVSAVTVGRFDDQVVCRLELGRWAHDRIGFAPEIAAECDPLTVDVEIEPGGAENVPRRMKPAAHISRDVYSAAEVHGLQLRQTVLGLCLGVERLGGSVPGVTFPVGVVGVLLLQMPRVA